MFGPRALVRPLLAAPFVLGGIQVLRSPEAVAPQAADVALPIADAVGLPQDTVTLVKINAGVQLGAGILLALGILPRLASVALAATIVPTTAAGHRFWEEKDPKQKMAQLTHFAKNAGLLGGLLVAALDTGGRPSVFWSSRRAAGKAAGSLSNAAHSVSDSVGSAVHTVAGVVS